MYLIRMRGLDKEMLVKLISAINMTEVMVMLIRKTIYMKLRIATQIAILKWLSQITARNIVKTLDAKRMPMWTNTQSQMILS